MQCCIFSTFAALSSNNTLSEKLRLYMSTTGNSLQTQTLIGEAESFGRLDRTCASLSPPAGRPDLDSQGARSQCCGRPQTSDRPTDEPETA